MVGVEEGVKYVLRSMVEYVEREDAEELGPGYDC